MTRPIYVETLRRMVTPPQYALLERLRMLYVAERLDVDSAGLLRTPELKAASNLVALNEFLEINRTPMPRQGRCNWLDDVIDPPVGGSLEETQVWVDKAVSAVNEQLRMIEMFED